MEIELSKGRITKKVFLDDEKFTFFYLKQEVNNDMNLTEIEFFLTNDQGVVFLDHLNVKRALFPFKSLRVKNYIPTLYVLEK